LWVLKHGKGGPDGCRQKAPLRKGNPGKGAENRRDKKNHFGRNILPSFKRTDLDSTFWLGGEARGELRQKRKKGTHIQKRDRKKKPKAEDPNSMILQKRLSSVPESKGETRTAKGA